MNSYLGADICDLVTDFLHLAVKSGTVSLMRHERLSIVILQHYLAGDATGANEADWKGSKPVALSQALASTTCISCANRVEDEVHQPDSRKRADGKRQRICSAYMMDSIIKRLYRTNIPLDVRAASANSAWHVISDSVVLSLLLHVDPLLLTANALYIWCRVNVIKPHQLTNPMHMSTPMTIMKPEV